MKTALLVALGLAALAAAPARSAPHAAAHPAAKPPDLEGIWSVNSTTKLERLSVYPSLVITEAQEKAIKPPKTFPDDDVGQEESEWQDEGWRLGRIGDEIRTSWVVDPADGKLPYTEAGLKLVSRPYTGDGPETRSTNDRCLPYTSAGPPMLNTGGSNIWKIVQAPGYVVFLLEGNHETRIVPIIAGPANPAPGQPPVWLGHSSGWYEGDTLLVRTTGFHPQQSMRRNTFERLYLSSGAVVTERFRRISATQILYAFEVHDPAVFSRDWRAELPLNSSRGPLYEVGCHEGNYSMTGILAGARREERDAAEATTKTPAR
ncbi:MAG: hypothetical protein ACJ798_06570 [Phenylobacterium sp.]